MMRGIWMGVLLTLAYFLRSYMMAPLGGSTVVRFGFGMARKSGPAKLPADFPNDVPVFPKNEMEDVSQISGTTRVEQFSGWRLRLRSEFLPARLCLRPNVGQVNN